MKHKFKCGDEVKNKYGIILTFNRYFTKMDGSFDFSLFTVKENIAFFQTDDFELNNYRREKLEKIKSKMK